MAANLPELAGRYRMRFAVSREHAPLQSGMRVVGLTIELVGSHDPPAGPALGVCKECRRAQEAVALVARSVVPSDWEGVTFEVRDLDTIPSSPAENGHRARVGVTITVLQGVPSRAMDTLVTHGFDEVVARLDALRIPERRRGRGSRPTPVTKTLVRRAR